MNAKQIKARLARIAELLIREENASAAQQNRLLVEYHALHAQLCVCNPGLPGD